VDYATGEPLFQISTKYSISSDELVIAEDEYLEDFEKLLSALNTIPSDRKGEFISQLYNLKFIKAVNLISGESSLLKPSKVYFNTEDLRNYFDGFDMAYFISDVLYTRFAENKLIPFLKEVGVEDKPRRIEFDPNLTGEEKQLLRNKSYESRYTRENYQRDYDLEGLDHFIEQTLTKEKSALLWKLILENIKSLHTLDAKYFFKGKYSWFYRTDYSQYFGAKYFNMIQQKEWLIDKNGAHRRPSEVTFSELSDVYLKESPNIEILKEELKFKPDAFDQLPEEDQSKWAHAFKGLVERLYPRMHLRISKVLENKTRQVSDQDEEAKNRVQGIIDNHLHPLALEIWETFSPSKIF